VDPVNEEAVVGRRRWGKALPAGPSPSGSERRRKRRRRRGNDPWLRMER
jgi:hypothetical protein